MLLSFPAHGVRAETVKLVKKWRIVLELQPLDPELVAELSASHDEIMRKADQQTCVEDPIELHTRTIEYIEYARCLDPGPLQRAKQSLDLFSVCPVSKQMLQNSDIVRQMEKFFDHPDDFIRAKCAEITHRWRLLYPIHPITEHSSVQLDTEGPPGATPDQLRRLLEVPRLASNADEEACGDQMITPTLGLKHAREDLEVRTSEVTEDTSSGDWAAVFVDLVAQDLLSSRKFALLTPNHNTMPTAASFTCQTFPEFQAWVKDFTKIDDRVIEKLEGKLWKIYRYWPSMIEQIGDKLLHEFRLQQVVDDSQKAVKALEEGYAKLDPVQFDKKAAFALLSAHMAKTEASVEAVENLSANIDSVPLRKFAFVKDQLLAFYRTCAAESETRLEASYIMAWQDMHEELKVAMVEPLKTLWEAGGDNIPPRDSELDDKMDIVTELLSNNKEKVKLLDLEQLLNIQQFTSKLRSVESLLAKERAELGKQKSKYYQDVEKGVHETTHALRDQLKAAKAEASLYRQMLSANEALQMKVRKLEQDHVQVSAAKANEELQRRTAEEATRLMAEGYEQLKKSNEELEAKNVELQADNEQLVESRDDLRHSGKTEPSLASSTPPPAHAFQNAEVTSPATKRKNELHHLDSTITVWEKSLADANIKQSKTQEKKDKVDAQIKELKDQIKALKQSQRKTPTAPTPAPSPIPPQTTNDDPPMGPKPVTPWRTTSRRPAPIQEQFPALAPGNATTTTASGLTSMRIMPKGARRKENGSSS
jgi:hypothetical protein